MLQGMCHHQFNKVTSFLTVLANYDERIWVKVQILVQAYI